LVVAALELPVVPVICEAIGFVSGDFLHIHVDATARPALQPVDLFRKVHSAQDGLDLFVLVGREELGGVPDRHPFDRDERLRWHDAAHVNDSVDANFAAPADARAVKEPDPGGQEALVLDHAAFERSVRSDQNVVTDLDRVPLRAADVDVLTDDALRTDPNRRAVRLDYSAVGDMRAAGR
jgi:hypothetical protein